MADAITFARSDEQSMLADALGDMLASTADAERTRELSLTNDAFDKAVWDGLTAMGLVGLGVEERYGGAGSGAAELGVVFEELGRSVVATPLLSTVMAMDLIGSLGSDEQKAAWLPGLASGEVIGTVALYESAHDTSLQGLATTASATADGWALSGSKRWVTDAANAQLIVVVARTEAGLGAFVVDAETSGVTIEPVAALDATRPLGDVTLDCTVPTTAMLEGDASTSLSSMLDLAVALIAMEQVGGTQRCLEMSVDYAKSRFQFGRAIGSFQAIKHKCADMLVATEHARSAAWHAVTSLGTPEALIAVPLARSVCSDAYLFAASENIQIHGGIGFTWEHDAHLYFKRAKADSLLFGGVEAHRDRLGDALGV